MSGSPGPSARLGFQSPGQREDAQPTCAAQRWQPSERNLPAASCGVSEGRALEMRHHGFSCSSLYTVTPEQAQENLLIDDIASLIDTFEESYPKCKQLLKAVEAFSPSITNNGHLIPHDGERYRHGAARATGFVESTVHQVVRKRFCKQQQMQWSKRGANRLLQTRVKTLNRALGSLFKQWYPDMEVEEVPDAA